MDFQGYIDRHKTTESPHRQKYSTKIILNALVVSASLIFYIHVISIIIPYNFVHGTSFEPASWPIILLDGRPDNLVINDRDGSIFLPINGDIYKYSSNLSLLISTATRQSVSPVPPETASQYKNKLLKIIRFGNPDLLLSCWQNLNNSLRCVFYSLNNLKFVPVIWYLPNDEATTFKTDPDEEFRAISSSYDINDLVIVTSRPKGMCFDLEIGLRGIEKDSVTLPRVSQFKVVKNQSTLQLDMHLTSVLPFRNEFTMFKLFYDYIYMFNYDDHTYFVLNDMRKPKVADSESEKETVNSVRLARVCRNDSSLSSYTEISITCNNQNDAYAKGAYLDTTRSAQEQILYIITERGVCGDPRKKPNSARSYICSYSMRLIQDVFHRAVSDCHEGLLPVTLLDKLHPETDQAPICQKNPSKDWCSSATNPYIDGSSSHYLVKEDTFIQLDGLTSVNFLYTTSQGKSNPKDVYFIGTESGLLTKIGSDEEPFYTIDLFSNQVKNFHIEGEKFSSIFSNESIASRRGTKYSAWGSDIFALTSRSEIHLLHINGCQFYTSCHACLTTRDPLQCVWCGNSCSAKDECDVDKQSTSSCPPLIKNFTPLSGPLTGNTRLSVVGESFGSGKGSLQVHVAGQECKVDWKASDSNKIECMLKPVEESKSSYVRIDVSDDTGYIALKGTATSKLPYNYRKVLIAGNHPGYVSSNDTSGVTIFGENLDVGADRKVLFGDTECYVTKVEEKQLKCSMRPFAHELDGENHSFRGNLKFIVDGIEQEYLKPLPPHPYSNLSNSLEILDIDNVADLASDNGILQDGGSLFNGSNLFLTLILLVLLTVLMIYLMRYGGFSHLRFNIVPKSSNGKSDIEAAKMNLRITDENNFIMHDPRGRPSESLSGLIKLNDLTSDYFSKSDQIEQDKPLMHDLVDDEMMSILKQEKILIERNRLTLGHVLGSGQFGRVYKGFLKVENAGEHATVAVKTLHNRCHWDDSDNNQAFLEEGLMMKDFAHENVLALIGVTFDSNGLPMVITPFMLYGDLRSYISDEASSPTVKELIEFGIQVAKGMAYLSSLKFVHRDLAARNCMLDENLIVKVADFGLSRDIYERDYYSSDNKKAKLPVKWMAIESLEKSVYSTKTDVWSYGVLLWELMTRGVVPYPDVDNFDLFSYLKEGRRMLRPRYCPVNLYRIMQACWSANPEDRPTFDELVTSVSNVITQLQEAKDSSCGQQKVSRDETYCDVVR